MNTMGRSINNMGDSIMAFWNAPLDDPKHAIHACQSALAMLQKIVELNTERDQRSDRLRENRSSPIQVGIGINTGACVVGNLGSEQRFDYSVLGDSVNMAFPIRRTVESLQLRNRDWTQYSRTDQRMILPYLEVDLIALKGQARGCQNLRRARRSTAA